MPAFVFKGKSKDGKVVSGERSAENKDAVMAMLRRENIVVSSVKEKGKEVAVPRMGGGVPAKDLAIFVRQFSVMIDAGLPLVQCLEILGSSNENKTFAKILTQTRMDVEGGSTLAEAMRKHPKAFDDLFCNMIAAGEAGGILDTILKRLATYIEKSVKLKAQIKGAMMYPVAVISIAAIVITVILWKVIPTFAAMFAGLGATLPLPTRIVIAMSNWLVRLFLPLIIGGFLFVTAFRKYYATYNGRRVVDRMMLRMPVFGDLIRKVAVSKFCRTLATLISSGVPILDGLEITAKTSGNAIVEDAIMSVRMGVESGLTIAQPLNESNIFPAMVVQMIGVGE
ncbi:MAG: type II secretion system F family protein, partial [Thermoanaerobaculia bacterium]